MAKRASGGKQTDDERTKHTIVMPGALWVRLKVAAVEDRDDVSAILCRLAEDYLKRRGGRR